VRLRRWFKHQHGMTFQAYQRFLKIGRACMQIKQGEKVIDSAYDNGYNSLSGFNASFRKVTGFVPSDSRRQKIARTTQITTALGPMLAAVSENGLCLLEFCDRETLHKQIARVQQRLGVVMVAGEHELFQTLQNQLDEYFSQRRTRFEIPLELGGTEFQRHAWSYLQSIPYAQTRSYQQEAESIGNPAAVRAVGHANGQNAIAIIIPCHRVISKNGGLSGYAGGIWRKKFLLELEQAGPVSL
jgi:AraC family transcriptional regulator of adaptative response/methylated-DNA-[protein]-cysteine methyltransferase